MRLAISFILLSLFLSACGQKGGLYMPQQVPPLADDRLHISQQQASAAEKQANTGKQTTE